MTEASASVGLLLATALLIKMPHSGDSLLSATDKVLSLDRSTNKSTLEFLKDRSSSNSLNTWPPISFHTANFLS